MMSPVAALTIRAIISFIHSTTMYLFFIMWWDLGQVSSTKDIRVKKNNYGLSLIESGYILMEGDRQ